MMNLILLCLAAALVGVSVADSPELRYEDDKGCGKGCELCDSEADICARCAPGNYYDDGQR